MHRRGRGGGVWAHWEYRQAATLLGAKQREEWKEKKIDNPRETKKMGHLEHLECSQ